MSNPDQNQPESQEFKSPEEMGQQMEKDGIASPENELALHRHAHTEAYPLTDEQAMLPKKRYEEKEAQKDDDREVDPQASADLRAQHDQADQADQADQQNSQANINDLA